MDAETFAALVREATECNRLATVINEKAEREAAMKSANDAAHAEFLEMRRLETEVVKAQRLKLQRASNASSAAQKRFQNAVDAETALPNLEERLADFVERGAL